MTFWSDNSEVKLQTDNTDVSRCRISAAYYGTGLDLVLGLYLDTGTKLPIGDNAGDRRHPVCCNNDTKTRGIHKSRL